MIKTRDRIGRWALAASAFFFGLYLANVILGKATALMGAGEPMSVGDVPEFLCLFTAAIFFVIGALSKEQQARAESSSRPREDMAQ